VITTADRAWFARCRRAWNLGALGRRALEPAASPTGDRLSPAMRAALAVHYYPGMWAWDRSIVSPLVAAAYDRERGPSDGRRLLAGFQQWSMAADRFTPLRVEADLDVAVPDPSRPDHDLSGPDGQRVRYRDRIPLVLVDDDERTWLGDHRVVEAFAHPDELALDERLLTACWAWEQIELHVSVGGVYVTELRTDGQLRRTVVRHTTTSKRLGALRLGAAVRAMLADDVTLDPTPAWSHCCDCSFRSPCLALNRGEDAEPLLAADFRRRSPDVMEEGRLGGASWGMGRGAAPPHFDEPPST
jgi:hypothetical protein